MDKARVIENRRKWVEALRSGEFQQCRTYIRDGGAHCCIGVAYTAIAGKAVPDRGESGTMDCYQYVEEACGYKAASRIYFLNDTAHWPFSRIADFIEQHIDCDDLSAEAAKVR